MILGLFHKFFMKSLKKTEITMFLYFFKYLSAVLPRYSLNLGGICVLKVIKFLTGLQRFFLAL